jgi:hypothetical protein
MLGASINKMPGASFNMLILTPEDLEGYFTKFISLFQNEKLQEKNIAGFYVSRSI